MKNLINTNLQSPRTPACKKPITEEKDESRQGFCFENYANVFSEKEKM